MEKATSLGKAAPGLPNAAMNKNHEKRRRKCSKLLLVRIKVEVCAF
jgi:hypothetical protein